MSRTPGALQGAAARLWPLLALIIPVWLVTMVLSSGAPDIQRALTAGLVNLILVVGLYIFVGNSGIVSFGQISFMAIGAYMGAYLTIPVESKGLLLPDLPGFLANAHTSTTVAVILGGLTAALVAALLSAPLMRLKGIAASMATLSLLLIVQSFFGNWTAGGSSAITRVPTDTTSYRALLWVVLAICAAYAFQRSRFGLRLKASREDEVAAEAAGIRVHNHRRLAFVLSAFWMGVGGALYGHLIGTFSAETFYFQITFITLAALVVGGMNSLFGAVVGTALIVTVQQVCDHLEQGDAIGPLAVTIPTGLRDMIVAVGLVLILILRPDGLTGGREVPIPGWLRRTRAADRQKVVAPPSSDPASGS